MQAEIKNNRTPTNQTLLCTDIYSESHNKVQVYHTLTLAAVRLIHVTDKIVRMSCCYGTTNGNRLAVTWMA